MTRPSALPEWATNANYTAGPDIGSATKLAPTAGEIGEGYYRGYKPPARKLNWLLNNISEWLALIGDVPLLNPTISDIDVSSGFAYGNMVEFAGSTWVGSSSDAYVLYGDGNGSAWKRETVGVLADCAHLMTDGTTLLVCERGSTRVRGSTDGDTWSSFVSLPAVPSTFGAWGALYHAGSGLWIAGRDGYISYSADPSVSWTNVLVGTGTSIIRGLATSGPEILCKEDGATDKYYRSTNGTSYSLVLTAPGDSAGPRWLGDRWAVVGDSAYFATSPDGVTWTSHTPSSASYDLLDIFADGDVWFAIAHETAAPALHQFLIYSADSGATWHQLGGVFSRLWGPAALQSNNALHCVYTDGAGGTKLMRWPRAQPVQTSLITYS